MTDLPGPPTARPPYRPAARTFDALRHRNFRLFYYGQLISLAGTWMQVVAQSWLVLTLTNSPFYVGLVTALESLPVMLFSLHAGVLVDRVSRHRLVIAAQAGMMVPALILAVLSYTGLVSVWHVMALAALYGVFHAVDIPARQTLFSELVHKEDLMNAVALNSSAFNATRIVGPSIAGILIAAVGVATCFLVNGLSYIAVLTGLLAMRLPPDRHTARPPVLPPSRPTAVPPVLPPDRPTAFPSVSTWSTIREGLAHVANDRRMLAMMVLLANQSVFGSSVLVLLPIFARDVMGHGAIQYGWMMTALGVGALTGALGVATWARQIPKGRVMIRSSAVFGTLLIAFSMIRSLPLALAVLVLSGLAMVVSGAIANTLLQHLSPDRLRGRVMSLYSLVAVGLAPFGALQAGAIAEQLGAPIAIAAGGFVCLASALVAMLKAPELMETR
jgi:MFS family permease